MRGITANSRRQSVRNELYQPQPVACGQWLNMLFIDFLDTLHYHGYSPLPFLASYDLMRYITKKGLGGLSFTRFVSVFEKLMMTS
jgi:hypothetical protein